MYSKEDARAMAVVGFVGGLTLMCLMFVAMALSGAITTPEDARREMHSKAVAQGLGQLIADPRTGETEFKLNQPKDEALTELRRLNERLEREFSYMQRELQALRAELIVQEAEREMKKKQPSLGEVSILGDEPEHIKQARLEQEQAAERVRLTSDYFRMRYNAQEIIQQRFNRQRFHAVYQRRSPFSVNRSCFITRDYR